MERENLSFRSAELTVKMTRGSWRFKPLSRAPGGSPCGSDYKESTCNAGDTGSIHGLGRSPGEGHGYPLQYFCLWNPMDRGAWQGCSPWGCRESYMTEHVHTHTQPTHTSQSTRSTFTKSQTRPSMCTHTPPQSTRSTFTKSQTRPSMYTHTPPQSTRSTFTKSRT